MALPPWLIFCVIVSVLVLLPLVPSFILFRLLPSTAVVSGPFQGLKINLGGAVGAYFLILVAMLTIPRDWVDDSSYEEYTLRGEVVLDAIAGDLADRRRIILAFDPRKETISNPISGNTFRWTMKTLRRADGHEPQWSFDAIIVQYPDYGTEIINLEDGAIDAGTKRISFPSVRLKKLEINDASNERVLVLQ